MSVRPASAGVVTAGFPDTAIASIATDAAMHAMGIFSGYHTFSTVVRWPPV